MLKYNEGMPYNYLDLYHIDYDDINCFDDYAGKAIVYNDRYDEPEVFSMERYYSTTEQERLFEMIKSIICSKYDLITSMDGMLHRQIQEVDELIDECNFPLDFYGKKIPASDAVFHLHLPLYTSYAQAFFLNQINEFFETLLRDGKYDLTVTKWSDFLQAEVTNVYTFKVIDYQGEEEE